MKKIAIALVIIIVMSNIVSANELNISGATAQTTVYCHIESQYCVMIPETVVVGNNYTFSAATMDLCEGERVEVTVEGIADDGTFSMQSGQKQMIAKVYSGAGEITPGQAVAFFENGQFETMDYMQIVPISSDGAGDYYGTITFGINLVGGMNP